MLSSRGSSQPRDWTRISGVFCIAGGFFTAEPQEKSLYLCLGSCYGEEDTHMLVVQCVNAVTLHVQAQKRG